MRAVLVIPDQKEAPCATAPCLSLFPLMDRPFLQHVVEALVGRGVTDIQVVCGRGADAVERFLGDGSRWGCSFSFHFIADPERPECILRAIAADDGPVILARADQLPILPNSFSPSGRGTLFGRPYNWSGWAVMHSRQLRQTPSVPMSELSRHIGGHDMEWVSETRPLVLRSMADIPAAQQRLLHGEVPGTVLAAREIRPGIWLAPNVRIEPTSTLRPPVFVGENSIIGAGARVGPYAVVGANCMLDRDSSVQETTVCPGTYVGPGVELDGVIVEGSSLINPRRQTRACIDHRFLDRVAPALPFTFSPGRLLAASLYILCLPLLLAIALWLRLTRSGPVFWQRRFIRAPFSTDESVWEESVAYTLTPPRLGQDEYAWVIPASVRGAILELLPALWSVARGHLRLVGIAPRGREQLRSHSAQCPALLRASPGLITELALVDSEPLSPEDCLLVDGFQTQTTGSFANRKRLCRYLLKAMMFWGQAARNLPLAEPGASNTSLDRDAAECQCA